jgi:hypothetical protein
MIINCPAGCTLARLTLLGTINEKIQDILSVSLPVIDIQAIIVGPNWKDKIWMILIPGIDGILAAELNARYQQFIHWHKNCDIFE